MIDINNESGTASDEAGLVRLAAYVLGELRIHPQADLSLVLVDPATMAQYHERYMGLPGATDVLSFPMDELRVPSEGQPAPQGLLGDIMLCPEEVAKRAPEFNHTPSDHMSYLLIHGLLHLLGYDHAEPDEEREMFSLQDRLYAGWKRHGRRA